MSCCSSVAPRPPYSFGQWMHIQPPSLSLRCHARRRSNSLLLSASSSLSPRQSRGTFCSSHERNSWRNFSSSSLYLKSMARLLGELSLMLAQSRSTLQTQLSYDAAHFNGEVQTCCSRTRSH